MNDVTKYISCMNYYQQLNYLSTYSLIKFLNNLHFCDSYLTKSFSSLPFVTIFIKIKKFVFSCRSIQVYSIFIYLVTSPSMISMSFVTTWTSSVHGLFYIVVLFQGLAFSIETFLHKSHEKEKVLFLIDVKRLFTSKVFFTVRIKRDKINTQNSNLTE